MRDTQWRDVVVEWARHHPVYAAVVGLQSLTAAVIYVSTSSASRASREEAEKERVDELSTNPFYNETSALTQYERFKLSVLGARVIAALEAKR